jgi:hypothetical protein
LDSAKQSLADAEVNARAKLERIEVDSFEAPEPEIKVEAPEPLFTTEDDFAIASRKLIRRKELSGIQRS